MTGHLSSSHPVLVGGGRGMGGCFGANSRARPAACRVALLCGPSPALAPFPVPGRSSLCALLRMACTAGGSCADVGGLYPEDSHARWRGRPSGSCPLHVCGFPTVAACTRGPPSSTSASTSCLSRPVLPRLLWRVGSWGESIIMTSAAQ
jgi:hypothetical protein